MLGLDIGNHCRAHTDAKADQQAEDVAECFSSYRHVSNPSHTYGPRRDACQSACTSGIRMTKACLCCYNMNSLLRYPSCLSFMIRLDQVAISAQDLKSILVALAREYVTPDPLTPPDLEVFPAASEPVIESQHPRVCLSTVGTLAT